MNIAFPGAPLQPSALALEQARRAVLNRFREAGYTRIEPPILQEAATFLDFGGEDMRAALYMTSDAAGRELCLRPDYTIPACRGHLAAAGETAGYCYCGPVFRLNAEGSGEAVQAGIESYGRTDSAAADAEILSVVLEAAAAAGAPDLRLSMGDAGLFARFLDALALPPLWQRRLRRGLDHGQPLDAILAGAPSGAAGHAGVLAALTGADGRDARALVEDLLSIAGIAAIGGRSVGEIAERFLAQVVQHEGPGFGAERRALLERFLGVAGDPDRASVALRALARDAGLDLGAALDLFDERIGFIAAQGIDVGAIDFQTRFGRNLDYYTGFVFEARAAAGGEVVAGGGRYDRLAQALGATAPIPAVGGMLWIGRLLGREVRS